MSIPFLILGILCLIIGFVAVILVRAGLYIPPVVRSPEIIPVHFEQNFVTGHLARMLQIPTVSDRELSRVDLGAFSDFRDLLVSMYPSVTAHCKRELAGPTGVFYFWKGKNSAAPTVLMAHYDVVPAEAERWTHPPFSGYLDNEGVLWGRGAIDTKITLCGIMEAAEAHIKNGFVPQNDIYLAFSGDEEVMGPSAAAIVSVLESRGVKCALVLDEGGAIVTDIFPGVRTPCAVIGIAEKGIMDVEFTVKSRGGHASAPPVKNPVGQLSEAMYRVETHPFPLRLTKTVRHMFDVLGRHSSFAYKILFANLWCFLPLLKIICSLTGGELNALMRTTCLFTVLEGSSAYNVMPQSARAGANLRLLDGETCDSAFERLRKIIANDNVEMRKVYAFERSPEADIQGFPWQTVTSAVRQTWPDVLVAPYLMVACSDSRHFCRISETVLRFAAMEMSKEERSTIHAQDERIPGVKIPKACEFFYRVIAQV